MILFAILGLLALASILFYVLIKQRGNFLLLAILIPITLFSVGYSWFIIENFKGYAVAELPNNAQVLKIYKQKPRIYLLLQTDKGPRLHVVPWNQENSKRANDAQQRMDGGEIIFLEKVERTNDGELRFYKWDHKKSFPKSG